MLNLFSKLFKSDDSSDKLNQLQREGIVDLLLLAMYSDNHLSLFEDAIIEKNMTKYKWDSPTDLNTYIQIQTAKVRSVNETENGRKHFLDIVSNKLHTAELRKEAYQLCLSVFISDGDHNMEESNFSKEIKTAFDL